MGGTSAGWRPPPRHVKRLAPRLRLVGPTGQYNLAHATVKAWRWSAGDATFPWPCRKIGVLLGLIAIAFTVGIAAAGAGGFAWVMGVIGLAGALVCVRRAWPLAPVVLAAGAGLCAGR